MTESGRRAADVAWQLPARVLRSPRPAPLPRPWRHPLSSCVGPGWQVRGRGYRPRTVTVTRRRPSTVTPPSPPWPTHAESGGGRARGARGLRSAAGVISRLSRAKPPKTGGPARERMWINVVRLPTESPSTVTVTAAVGARLSLP